MAEGGTVNLTSLVQTCFACPSQWHAWDADGTYYYIRYRWGFLSVDKGDVMGEPIFGEQVGDDLDGSMDAFTMLKHTGMTLAQLGRADG
jgi:hypothetical protein